MIRTLLSFLIFALPNTGMTQILTVKSDAVQINFVADMHHTKGTLSGFKATIIFNLDDLSTSMVNGTVDVSTLETGNLKRDEHLKSADFFEAKTYPTMSFKSSSVVKRGDKFAVTGKMKIKDVEHEEVITFSFNDNMFIAETTIQASKYNFGFQEKKPEKTNVKISFLIPVS